jgi:hypothetical protein
MYNLSVIVLDWRSAELTIGALRSLESGLGHRADCCALVVNNALGDGSAEAIEDALREYG